MFVRFSGLAPTELSIRSEGELPIQRKLVGFDAELPIVEFARKVVNS